MNDLLLPLIQQFSVKGTISEATPYGSGHIHHTYRLHNADPSAPDYLLQQINHQVFTRVPELMANIELVTNHIRQKQPDQVTLTLVPTRSGQSYHQDTAGNYWRVFIFLPNTHTCDVVQLPEQAYEGGKAFGEFLAVLSDIPGHTLHETIPYFHNIEKRWQTFQQVVAQDPVERVNEVTQEIQFMHARVQQMRVIEHLGKTGEIPLRITHNDTKFNNVLLNDQEKAVCVIDLDTVMPGYVHYDFGDALRTILNTATEDEADIRKIEVDIRLFDAYAEGYLARTAHFLTPAEINHLAFSPQLMAFIMALRFLTDYLAGDQYYKIQFESHNVQRARAQIQLLRKLEEQYSVMQTIIQRLLA